MATGLKSWNPLMVLLLSQALTIEAQNTGIQTYYDEDYIIEAQYIGSQKYTDQDDSKEAQYTGSQTYTDQDDSIEAQYTGSQTYTDQDKSIEAQYTGIQTNTDQDNITGKNLFIWLTHSYRVYLKIFFINNLFTLEFFRVRLNLKHKNCQV